MKIVIKIGTQSILSDQGLPIEPVVSSLVSQMAELQKQNHRILLVASGAVGLGRRLARELLGKEYGAGVGERQVLASLGQHELISLYSRLFQVHNLLAAQLLLTKQDFNTRRHYLNVLRLITEISKHDHIIPIVNENDSVAIEELMFTDNDELSGLLAAQINADKLILLSQPEGVYTSHPDDPNARLIEVLEPGENWPTVSQTKSAQGRGGMASKLSTAHTMAKLGIVTHIAAAAEPGVLARIVAGERVGTLVLAHKKKSNIKRWIAYSSQQKTGRIHVNAQLAHILQTENRAVSILPVGIASWTGFFAKGDIIELFDPAGHRVIGVGKARYDSKTLAEFIGKQHKPPLVHYNELHLF